MSLFLFYSHLTRLPNWKVFFSRTFLWHALKESRKTTDLLNPLPPQPPPEKKLQQNERISPGNEISPRTSITKLCVWFFFFLPSDQATLGLMKTPRCSLPDMSELETAAGRRRRALAPQKKWTKRHLSWRYKTALKLCTVMPTFSE